MVITYVQAAMLQQAADTNAANRLWKSHVAAKGRKPLPFYGIREVHRGNLSQAKADKLWQGYVDSGS